MEEKSNWFIEFITKLLKSLLFKQVEKINDVKKEIDAVMPYLVTMDELLDGNKLEDQETDVQNSLKDLYKKINLLRNEYGDPMTVSSGLRGMKQHLAIYAKKGVTDKNKIPMGSAHLKGSAVDIYDPNKKLQKWVKDNEKKVIDIGFWMEDFNYTPDWVHFQTYPPFSGKRYFKP